MDLFLVNLCNRFSGQYVWLDRGAAQFADNSLLKGTVLALAIWGCWFGRTENLERTRRGILEVLVSALFAMGLARGLAWLLPFRPRPLVAPDLDWIAVEGISKTHLSDWSSMPSDHAALFFCIAFGFLRLSPLTGGFLLLYSAVFVSLPRIYLGLHYPSDILVGAILGIGVSLAMQLVTRRWWDWSPRALDWVERQPRIFYGGFFLFTFQLAVMFHDVRMLGSSLWKAVRLLSGG